MKTGFRGTFVISWSQTELDGLWSAPLDTLRVGTAWSWTGEAVRVDGPSGVLPLGDAKGEADLRKRAAMTVRRLLRAVEADTRRLDLPEDDDPLFDNHFNVTDGRDTWTVTLIGTGKGKNPLLMFMGAIPPRQTDLWVVSHTIDLAARDQTSDAPGGVICFTPGTVIQTELGPRDVAELAEGDRIQTKDNGCQEILWIGARHLSGARLYAMPHLRPVRLREGALDQGVPDAGLLVSPDHRMVLRGARARLLFNTDEVLVTARDLVNDATVMVDRAAREVTYIHLLLPSHQVVFANAVETESFHPASAAMASIDADEQDRLFSRLPDLRGDAQTYGTYARRVLSQSEAAILRHDAGWSGAMRGAA
jgi:hypothetical protein